jgi:hypothetical protein
LISFKSLQENEIHKVAQREFYKNSVGTQVSATQIEEEMRLNLTQRIEIDISPEFKNLKERREINNFYPISKENRKSFFYPGSLIETDMIPNDKISWSVMWLGYKPTEYADPSVVRDGFFKSIESCLGEYEIVNKRPLNPFGRTGFVFIF